MNNNLTPVKNKTSPDKSKLQKPSPMSMTETILADISNTNEAKTAIRYLSSSVEILQTDSKSMSCLIEGVQSNTFTYIQSLSEDIGSIKKIANLAKRNTEDNSKNINEQSAKHTILLDKYEDLKRKGEQFSSRVDSLQTVQDRLVKQKANDGKICRQEFKGPTVAQKMQAFGKIITIDEAMGLIKTEQRKMVTVHAKMVAEIVNIKDTQEKMVTEIVKIKDTQEKMVTEIVNIKEKQAKMMTEQAKKMNELKVVLFNWRKRWMGY